MFLFYVSLSSDVINVFAGGGGLREIVLPKYSNRQSFSLYVYIDIAELLDLTKYSVLHGI